MSSKKITYQLIYEAYRKLKNYVYYDNTMLILRSQISEFETRYFKSKETFTEDFKNVFKGLYDALNNEDEKEYSSLLTQISYNIVPKSVATKPLVEEGVIINAIDRNEVDVDNFNILIKAPIQIHVLSVLWVMIVGKHLDCYNEEHNYAYRLYKFDEDNQGDEYKNNSLKLFKPYYEGYQNWRDNALKKASELLDAKKDATIFSIDIKRYYYNVRVNVVSLVKDLLDLNFIEKKDADIDIIKTLNNMLQSVNVYYSKKINCVLQEISESISEQDFKEGNVILPVGLLSSGVIANLYLREFDKSIINKLNPAYYGRYVDDMLFVFSNRELDLSKGNVKNNFIDRQFVESGIFKKMDSDDSYMLKCSKTLIVQSNKIVLEHFYHKGSRAALHKFIKNIEKNRSEFRFLPEEDALNNEFDSHAFQLLYSGSVNKIRNIQSISSDKFGASKYLSSKIMLAKSENFEGKTKKTFKKTAKQILTYFSGDTTISFYTLWEKVTTLFVLYKDFESLNTFINSSYKFIQSIKYVGNEKTKKNDVSFVRDKLAEHLIETLKIAVSMPLALTKESYVDKLCISSDLVGNSSNFINEIKKYRKNIRHSSFFRQDLMILPCLHLLDDNSDEFDYLDFDLKNIKLSSDSIQYENILKQSGILSPRFIPYHEFCVFMYCKNRIISKNEFSEIADSYSSFNFDWLTLFLTDNRSANILEGYIKEKSCVKDEQKNKYLSFPRTKIIDEKLSIGIVNMNVSDKDIESNLKGYPNRSQERYNKLVEILNYSAKKDVDLLVLPEVSVPLIWLSSLIRISLRHNMGIICGLEHVITNDGYAYNDVATVLPFNTNDTISCSVTFRTKNYYSPSEKELIEGYRLKLPSSKGEGHEKVYEHDHWRGVFFSTYNCYELTNVEDRGIFKSEVDFLVATEWNKDTSYFSDIVGSWCRDLHCYFVQVNTSQYGDSKILSPSKQEEKNILSVKGGKFDVVLVGDLDIKALREFQLKEHNIQKTSNSGFKQTPPEFNRVNVKKRIDNKEICDFT